ncbi:hypothetical protein [Photobacterium angustum]|uniref:hypothetical protein n=1 Tax=Photobacterium angustum TaxID=661 RepID=UPI0005DD1ECC|nr:hypothetical protein [Photobacterium angustum]KJG00124.1 hypothetical protein UB35_19945 [Photobacterium angustum]PSV61685.1 hypothetical protein CTM95_20500 [Photobacterium angustum]
MKYDPNKHVNDGLQLLARAYASRQSFQFAELLSALVENGECRRFPTEYHENHKNEVNREWANLELWLALRGYHLTVSTGKMGLSSDKGDFDFSESDSNDLLTLNAITSKSFPEWAQECVSGAFGRLASHLRLLHGLSFDVDDDRALAAQLDKQSTEDHWIGSAIHNIAEVPHD